MCQQVLKYAPSLSPCPTSGGGLEGDSYSTDGETEALRVERTLPEITQLVNDQIREAISRVSALTSTCEGG